MVCLPEPVPVLTQLETVTVVLFTIEYLLRVFTVGFLPMRYAPCSNQHALDSSTFLRTHRERVAC